MKEPYDDEKLYCEEQCDFGPIVTRNYKEVLQSYSYNEYQRRFGAQADSHELSPNQRPKLDKDQFASLMKQLSDTMLRPGEADPLEDEKTAEAARRLLLYHEFISCDENI
jgi:hypothetical protein